MQNERYKQPSAAFTRKAAAGGAGAFGMPGLALVLVWVGQQLGVEIPTDVAIWIAGVVGALGGGWIATERKQGA